MEDHQQILYPGEGRLKPNSLKFWVARFSLMIHCSGQPLLLFFLQRVLATNTEAVNRMSRITWNTWIVAEVKVRSVTLEDWEVFSTLDCFLLGLSQNCSEFHQIFFHNTNSLEIVRWTKMGTHRLCLGWTFPLENDKVILSDQSWISIGMSKRVSIRFIKKLEAPWIWKGSNVQKIWPAMWYKTAQNSSL